MNENQIPEFAHNWALFLDVDGTLLQHADHPEAVSFGPELADILDTLDEQVPLALISGRSLASLDALFKPLQLAAAGQHGAERRDLGGLTHKRDRLPRLSRLRTLLDACLAACPGTLLEDKGNTLAIHYRQAPQFKRQIEALLAEELRALNDLSLICGNMVFEVREQGIDKGLTIATFMQETPFIGRVPVFLGDDTTDEDGFSYVNSVGGHSIKVGEGKSLALWRIGNVGAVLSWLRDYVDWLAQWRSGERA